MQDAIIRNFEVMGEIVKRLGFEFTAQYPLIPWRRIAAFQDVVVHDYEGISLELIWQTIESELPALRSHIEALIETLPLGDEQWF